MTLFDVEELTRYWMEHPPLHLMLAAFLGIGKERHRRAGFPNLQTTAESNPGANVGQILAELGPAFASGDVHSGLDAVVLDFTELQRRTKNKN
jgi:hypothetical protein